MIAFAFLGSGVLSYGIGYQDRGASKTVLSVQAELDSPDLVVSDISWVDFMGAEASELAVITSGQPFTVLVTVTNAGGADSGEFSVDISMDGVPELTSGTIAGLAAGDSQDLAWIGIAVSDIGQHHITAEVDSADAVEESNPDGTAESNNIASEGFDVRSAKWTVAVYMDSDNNLEAYGILDFLEMSIVGSTRDVNVVVQMDRLPGYSSDYGDWTGTARFLVSKDMLPLRENAYSDLGEANMADPATLRDFAVDTFGRFQAESTCLILWDHGMGWVGGCCVDYSSGNDTLTTAEIREAMVLVKNGIGARIDIVGVDCCTMGSIEISYLFRDTCDIYVASQAGIPLEGWQYTLMLQPLAMNPLMLPDELAGVMVSTYTLSYEETPWFASLAAFWTDAVCTSVKDALSDFADAMISSESNIWSRIKSARNVAMDFDLIYDGSSYNDYYYADMYSFASEVASRVSVESIRASAEALMSALEAAKIVSSVHTDYLPYNAVFGMSVFWPEQDLYIDEYAGQELSADTSWDEFLTMFYSIYD